jgi:hypothetical protein
LHPIFFLGTVNSLLDNRIEIALKLPLTVPEPTQPNIEPGLSNQTHIALNLLDTILKTTTTRVELECSWEAIEHDINIQE